MSEIIVFKGKYEIINLPEFSSKADKLYDLLLNFFKTKGFSLKIIESKPDYFVKEHITSEVKLLIGHSRGANKILKEFSPGMFASVRGIIIFDPIAIFKEQWNNLKTPKLLFVSSWGQDYFNFENVIKINDDHYFNNSLEQIQNIIDQFLIKNKLIK